MLSAGNGTSALDFLRSGAKVDLLFTDVVMPGSLNGVQLAREAKRLRPDLKVLITSGYMDKAIEIEDEGLHDGAVLRKPYRPNELAGIVRRLLDEKVLAG